MAELKKIIILGKELALEGTALQKFLQNERAEYRDQMKIEEEMGCERMNEDEQRLRDEEERDKARSARRLLETNTTGAPPREK